MLALRPVCNREDSPCCMQQHKHTSPGEDVSLSSAPLLPEETPHSHQSGFEQGKQSRCCDSNQIEPRCQTARRDKCNEES